jgi:hypothetical protein
MPDGGNEMGMSPTQRTIRALKEQGRVCGIVEKWNSFAGIRQDLFGIIDIIALDPERGVVGIQTTGTGFSGHHKKLTVDKVQECVNWLSTPGACLELWGWRRILAKRGGKAKIWAPRIKIYQLSDFTEVNPFDGCDED